MSDVTLEFDPMPSLKIDRWPFTLSGHRFEEDHSLSYEEAITLRDSANAAIEAYERARDGES